MLKLILLVLAVAAATAKEKLVAEKWKVKVKSKGNGKWKDVGHCVADDITFTKKKDFVDFVIRKYVASKGRDSSSIAIVDKESGIFDGDDRRLDEISFAEEEDRLSAGFEDHVVNPSERSLTQQCDPNDDEEWIRDLPNGYIIACCLAEGIVILDHPVCTDDAGCSPCRRNLRNGDIDTSARGLASSEKSAQEMSDFVTDALKQYCDGMDNTLSVEFTFDKMYVRD